MIFRFVTGFVTGFVTEFVTEFVTGIQSFVTGNFATTGRPRTAVPVRAHL